MRGSVHCGAGRRMLVRRRAPPMTFGDFLRGPPAWRPGSAWGAGAATLATLLVVLAAQVIGAGTLYVALLAEGSGLASQVETTHLHAGGIDPRILLGSQAGIVMLTWLAAGWAGVRPADHLRLVRPEGGTIAYVWAVVALLPVLALVNALAWTLRPEDAVRDFRLFIGIARSPEPLLPFLAIGVGAPLSEELLFRGFLLTALASGRPGFAWAATIVTLAWTLLHWGYSPVGLAEVAIIGLYLSWTLWRTGSLLVPLFCHALYNTCLFMLLRWWPLA